MRKSCDIFCSVVDNYGDIGVCWRLARQLVAEHGRQVRLWIDELAAHARLCPDLDPTRERQTLHGVEVRRWATPFADAREWVDAADLVIEAFGCPLPPSYLAAMAARAARGVAPAWINLEYLSAEAWVDSHHGLPSPQPRLPLVKRFYFPGFSPDSGGLLREAGLLERRRNWSADWQELGLPTPSPGHIAISLFCYDNPALPALLQAWSAAETPIHCLLAPGPAQAQAAAWLGLSALAVGAGVGRGQLRLTALPFYPQALYDHLLWACDINFVRGEDSFLRAQWAAKPFVWQAYPQPAAAHLDKLAAFLERYCAGLAPEAAAAQRQFAAIWNGGSQAPMAPAWRRLLVARLDLAEHARRWAERRAAEEDLATRLVKFAEALI